MTDLLDLSGWTRDDLDAVFDRTDALRGTHRDDLDEMTLLMLFAKHSTRTRVSFETGMTELGGHAIYFPAERSQLARGESMTDTAHVLSRYVDGIMARLYAHDDLVALAEAADVPVINGLTDRFHPCQALADVYTLHDRGMDLADTHLVYVGDGNNVAHSLLHAATAAGMDITVSCPQGYEPDRDVVEHARETGEETGSRVRIVHDPHQAVTGADVIYTDVWVSMGDEDEAAERADRFRHYQVDADLVAAAGDPVVMHPLPAHRGQEITGEVLDGPRSIVYDQAENRLHVQKAVLADLLG